MIDPDAIPVELRSVPQWVCWTERKRGEKQTKIPVTPETASFASVQDPETWASFEVALETMTADESVAGIGFVFTENDPFVGVDLDGCRDPETGEADSWAAEIIDQLDSFSEVSPSGTGFHIYVRGELPDGRNRSGNIECYDAARFFTVTGEHLPETPTKILRRTAQLADIHATHISSLDSEVSGDRSAHGPSSTVSLDDEELVSRAMAAKNGPKFTRLWNGNTGGYDSQSEADMALCCLLAFWTQKDTTQMDRLFRQSGLYRDKWDNPHYSGGKTYGEGTIERAVAVTSDVYEPRENRGASSSDSALSPRRQSASDGQSSGEYRRHGAAVDYASSTEQTDTTELAAVETAVQKLVQATRSLEAQHEYLYESLEEEQKQREQLVQRVAELEEQINANRRSLLRRLLG